MIISDKHKFSFIHIPKCAGTSLRWPLQWFDDTNGRFTRYVGEHEVLGLLDYVHIPLKVLREHFTSEYEKLKKYQSYAVVRNPFSRFSSFLTQHANQYGDKQFQCMTKKEIQRSLDAVIS
jgi:hypothetical protein